MDRASAPGPSGTEPAQPWSPPEPGRPRYPPPPPQRRSGRRRQLRSGDDNGQTKVRGRAMRQKRNEKSGLDVALPQGGPGLTLDKSLGQDHQNVRGRSTSTKPATWSTFGKSGSPEQARRVNRWRVGMTRTSQALLEGRSLHRNGLGAGQQHGDEGQRIRGRPREHRHFLLHVNVRDSIIAACSSRISMLSSPQGSDSTSSDSLQ